MTIEIPLSKGYAAIVDRIDADLAELKWSAQESTTGVYAHRRPMVNGKQTKVYLHRVILERILGRPLVKGELCDHEHGNTLDCRREKLRLATHQQNCMNRQRKHPQTSKFKGISYSKSFKCWVAQIVLGKKHSFLGHYNDETDAAIAYNHAARDRFGDFVVLNDIPGWELITPTRNSKHDRRRNVSNRKGKPQVGGVKFHTEETKHKISASIKSKIPESES